MVGKIVKNILKNPKHLLTIANAWITAANPTPEQKELAERRYEICVGCEHFREKRQITGEPYCAECGCPMKKKIFTDVFNECPLGKWRDVDSDTKYDYFFKRNIPLKNTKTLF